MNEPMHDLLAAAIDRRARAFARGRAFADAHERRVVRAVRTRRVATYASVGSAAAAFAVGAGLGVAALADTPLNLFPAGQLSPDSSMSVPSITPSAPSLATQVTTTLVRVPLEDRYSTDGTTSRTYAYYSSVGATDMVSFPGGGLWYPGIPDVPADAVVLVFWGGVSGFDFTDEGGGGDMGIMPAWLDETNLYDYDLVGDRDFYDFQWTEDGQNASIAYDVIGDVTDHTRWGIHYYLVDGEVVKEIDGRANPDAVEVTAWFDPTAPAEPTASLATPFATTLVPVPLDDSIWEEGDSHRVYVFYASLGATDMVPSPYSGYWYPGIPDVPSDAVIVSVGGDVGGFDLTDPNSEDRQIESGPAWTTSSNWTGGLRGAGSGFDWEGYGEIATWEVIGEVTDHTSWGVHYFLLNGDVVTLVDGGANPDAVEVNAWFDPATFTAVG